jgi:hypothetical protein
LGLASGGGDREEAWAGPAALEHRPSGARPPLEAREAPHGEREGRLSPEERALEGGGGGAGGRRIGQGPSERRAGCGQSAAGLLLGLGLSGGLAGLLFGLGLRGGLACLLLDLGFSSGLEMACLLLDLGFSSGLEMACLLLGLGLSGGATGCRAATATKSSLVEKGEKEPY